MYAKDTILVLKEQRPPDEETGEPFPYNKIRVIGESPVSRANDEGWEGSDADVVLAEAVSNFGAVLDEPYGKLKVLYDVESIPEPVEVAAQPVVRVIDSQSAEAGQTPEEVFAAEAPGQPPEPGQKRARTGVSPLGEVRSPAADGPLGTVPVAPPAPPLVPDAPPTPEPAPAGPPAPPSEPPEAPPAAPESE